MESEMTNQSKASVDELNVSQILLDLKNHLTLPEYLPDFNWGRARKRSRPDQDPPSHKKSTPEKPTAASPTTPLSFSPIDSDNRNHSTETPIQNRDVPRGVLNEFPKSEVERNRRMDYRVFEYPIRPHGFNLNVPPVEDSRQPLDHKRPKCAEARRKRRALMRAKKYPTRIFSDGDEPGPLRVSEPLDDKRAKYEPLDDRRAKYAETRRQRRELMIAKRAKCTADTIRKRIELMGAKQEPKKYVSCSAMCAEARRKRRELIRAKRESKL